MNDIQVNFTPVPSGFSTNGPTVLIHISFIIRQASGAMSKVPFSDFSRLRDFMQCLSGRRLEVMEINTGKVLISNQIPEVEKAFWDTLNSNISFLQTTFHDKGSLQNGSDNLNAKIKEYDDLILKEEKKIEQAIQKLILHAKNLSTIESSIVELNSFLATQQADLNVLSTLAGEEKIAEKYAERLATLRSLKTATSNSIASSKASKTKSEELYRRYKLERQNTADAKAILDNFRDNKFISTEQDDAINIIKAYVGQSENQTAPAINASAYTSDTPWSEEVSFSDIIAYFSGYSKVMERLGLAREIELTDNAFSTTGRIGLRIIDLPSIPGIIPVFPKVNYQFDRNRLFVPEPKNTKKYIDGYLNLTSGSYSLLQNSFEEIAYRLREADGASSHSSDTTNGLFLIQNNSSTLIGHSPDPDSLYLEDLLLGYRIDIRNIKETQWHSLNERSYDLILAGQKVSGADEGFISTDSVTAGYELLKATDSSGKVNFIDLLELSETPGQYNYSINLAPGISSIKLGISISVQNGFSFNFIEGNPCTLTLTKATTQKPGEMIKAIQAELSKSQAAISVRLINLDNRGRLYYSGFKDGVGLEDKAVLASYLPSSQICHINGYSLSTAKYMGTTLMNYFSAKEGDLYGIARYMKDNNIFSSVKTPKGSLIKLRIGEHYQVRCRIAVLGGAGHKKEHPNNDYVLSARFLRQDPIKAPKLLMYRKKVTSSATTTEKQEQEARRLEKLGDSENHIFIRTPGIKKGDMGKPSLRLIAPPMIPWQKAEWHKMFDLNGILNRGIMEQTRSSRMPVYQEKSFDGKKVYVVAPGSGNFERYVDPQSDFPYIPDPMAVYFIIEPRNIFSISNKDKGNLDHHFDFSKQVIPEEINKIKLKLEEDLIGQFNDEFATRPCFYNDISGGIKGNTKGQLWTLEVVGSYENTSIKVDKALKKIIISMRTGDDIEFVMRSFHTDPDQLKNLYSLDGQLPSAALNKLKIGRQYDRVNINYLSEAVFRITHAQGMPNEVNINSSKVGSYPVQQFDISRSADYPDHIRITQGILFRGRTCSEQYLVAEWEEAIDDAVRQDQKLGALTDTYPLRILKHTEKVFNYHLPGHFILDNSQGEPGHMNVDVASPLVVELSLNKNKRRIYADMEGKNLSFRHKFPSQKFHAVRYYMVGVSRFSGYFEEKDSRLFTTDRTEYLSADKNKNHIAIATKAPDAPAAAYVLPLFETVSKISGTKIEKKFKGVRIYLNRPWFSSGFGEQLAVILSSDAPQDNEKVPFASRIGRDATTWLKAESQNQLVLADLYVRIIDYKYVHANGEYNIKVALFDVLFDLERELWFADVIIEASGLKENYCPFLELCIARFQTNADSRVKLSRAVKCEMMQIYPDRVLSFDKLAGKITISGSSFKYGSDQNLMSEIRCWFVSVPIAANVEEYLFDAADLKPENSKLAKPEGDIFVFEYDSKLGVGLLLIREFETFYNTLDVHKDGSFDVQTRRLLYTHVLKITR